MKTLLHKQSGFSLVELMVAMMIALIGLLAGSTMYLATKQTNRVQQMQDALTQDGRFVMHMLQQVISQAGFRQNPGLALGNDYLVPTSSTRVTVGFFGDTLSGVECDGSMSNGNKRVTISLNGASLQCSLQGGGAVNWIEPVGNGTEVASFLLEYGTDTGPNPTPASIGCGNTITPTTRPRDCVPDTYDLAVAQANQAQIMAVKACLVLRTVRTDSAIAKAAAINDCAGNAIAGSANDNRLYRTFRTTVLLRNR